MTVAPSCVKLFKAGQKAEVRKAFSPDFHNFVDIDLPGGWLLVEAERVEKGGRKGSEGHHRSSCAMKSIAGSTWCLRPRGNEADFLEIKECPFGQFHRKSFKGVAYFFVSEPGSAGSLQYPSCLPSMISL